MSDHLPPSSDAGPELRLFPGIDPGLLARPILTFPDLYTEALAGPPSLRLPMGEIVPLATALGNGYKGEASLASYLLPPEIGEFKQPRLSKLKGRAGLAWLASQGAKPLMHWLPLDLDTPGHVPWTDELRAEWWPTVLSNLRATEEGARAGVYMSQAGARFLWPLAEPLAPEEWERASQVLRDRLQEAGVPVDDLKDWTRLMRLPRITLEDGTVLHDVEIDLSQMAPISPYVPPGRAPLRLISTGPDLREEEATPPKYASPWEALDDSFPPQLLALLKEGRPLAPRPEDRGDGAPARNPEMVRVAGLVVAHMPRPDVEIALALLTPSVQAMIDEGAGDSDGVSLDKLEEKLELFVEREKERIAERRAAAREIASLDVSRRARGAGGADPLAALEHLPGALADADLTSRLVISDATGRGSWVWDEQAGQYIGPYTRTTTVQALKLFCPEMATHFTEGPRGGLRSADQVLYDCGQLADAVHMVLGADETRWDAERRVLYASAAPWADLEPEWNEEIHGWLRALGGDHPEQWLDWLATIRQVERPTCAIYIDGDPGAGKGLLVQGLSQLWRSETCVEYGTAMGGSFNEALMKSALIWADEEIPEDFRGQTSTKAFRRFTGNTTHYVKRKFLPELPVKGAYRTIITANNPDLFKVEHERLTVVDLAAIIERIGYLKSGPEPADRLAAAGGWDTIADWLEGRAIARHVLALEQDREVVPGRRYLVPGWKTSFHESLLSKAGINRQVLTLLAKCLAGLTEGTWQGDGIRAGGGHLWVNGPRLLKAWKILLPDQRVPPEHEISEALSQLSDPIPTVAGNPLRTTKSIGGRGMSCWNVRVREVLRYASELQLGEEEAMLARLHQDS